ncbi:MAG: DUF1501 domain-containing protein, partial [Phycisphaeraceae bacterium]
GFAMLPLADMLSREASGASAPTGGAHYMPRVRNVIFLFMSGGPSQMDLFDPKPLLKEQAGKPLPFEKPSLMRTQTQGLLASPFKFKRHGQSGTQVSELLPNIARCADDLCVIRSMVADNINHNGACLQMNTGEQAFSRPSLGSWLLYGLGTANQNLPGYVVISPQQPAQGAPLWSSAFMPAAYEGTLVSDLNNPISNVRNPTFNRREQRQQLQALAALDQQYRAQREHDSRLNARIESFELGFRMQSAAPEAFDVDRESQHTQSHYGIDEPETAHFGRQCLMARRLVERGVRFVQVYHTQTTHRTSCQLWDQHNNLTSELRNNCGATDKPVAALIQDL